MAGWVAGWEELEIRLSSGQLELELGLSLAKYCILKILTISSKVEPFSISLEHPVVNLTLSPAP